VEQARQPKRGAAEDTAETLRQDQLAFLRRVQSKARTELRELQDASKVRPKGLPR